MSRFKIGINERTVIESIGAGVLILAALTSPKLPQKLVPLIKKYGQKELVRIVKNLRSKRIVNLSGDEIKLTKRGRELLNEIYYSNFLITKNDNWDGQWRLVSYDVPEKYKKSRNIFRGILENNGFIQIHKSLWASPYNCKEEIAVFCKNLNMSNDVIVMTTDHLPNQKELTEHFNLKVSK